VPDRNAISPGSRGSERARAFDRDGFLFPVDVFSPSEIAGHFDALRSVEGQFGGHLPSLFNVKLYLLMPWLWNLIHDPRIVDPVADILGGDILCWEASFIAKAPGDRAHVLWHQDAPYRGLSKHDGVTAWIAFTPSNRENGCMKFVAESHRTRLPHRESHDADNMLPAGETVAVPVDEAAAVDVVLEAGQMSLHHPLLVHGSEPNNSQHARIGYAIRYIPGDVRQTEGRRGTAVLIRGKDHGHFDLEQQPQSDFDPEARKRHPDIFRRWMKIVSEEAKRDRTAAGRAD
jgi:non-heme Fe2+,alpha-ketoglutarate-dependent halogenase